MRVLVTNLALSGYSGTEIGVRDVVRGALARGVAPRVYAPRLGPIAEELRGEGVPVVDRLEDLPDEPDVVHGNHWLQTVEALWRFPTACGIFVCHDPEAWHDAPPRLPRLLRYVAVDERCRERLVEEAGIPPGDVEVVPNGVDLLRFQPRAPLPARPARALVFSHYAGTNSHLEPVREACSRFGIPVDVIGFSSGRVIARPEEILGDYDVVFAKGRAAQEAMAVGAAVVACDRWGLGGMVTSANVAESLRWNVGHRLLTSPLDPAGIAGEIERYDPADAAAVSRYVRANADVEVSRGRYVRLYEEVLAAQQRTPPDTSDEAAAFVRTALGAIAELGERVVVLGSEREHFRGEVGRLHALVAELERRQNSDGPGSRPPLVASVRVRFWPRLGDLVRRFAARAECGR